MRIRLRAGVLHSICKDLDISRDELSRRMGVATSTAYRIDSGDVEPSAKFIAALIHFTGKPFEALFEVVGQDAVVA